MAPQGCYWLLTIPYNNEETFANPITDSNKLRWCIGQLEEGQETGYQHWQVVANFTRAVRLGHVKSIFGDGIHAELSRSEAANDYVNKDETSLGKRFEYGKKPMNRNVSKDWDSILEHAKTGKFEEIPSDVLIRCYSSIKRIYVDNLSPTACERTVYCFWGQTGTGKSRRAWGEAGFTAYPKDPNTKFWDGYSGQSNVVLDEFRGLISISHVLRWFDRYPVVVEVKGSSTVLQATNIWITSNLHPKDWYKDLDYSTYLALERRLIIEEIN